MHSRQTCSAGSCRMCDVNAISRVPQRAELMKCFNLRSLLLLTLLVAWMIGVWRTESLFKCVNLTSRHLSRVWKHCYNSLVSLLWEHLSSTGTCSCLCWVTLSECSPRLVHTSTLKYKCGTPTKQRSRAPWQEMFHVYKPTLSSTDTRSSLPCSTKVHHKPQNFSHHRPS